MTAAAETSTPRGTIDAAEAAADAGRAFGHAPSGLAYVGSRTTPDRGTGPGITVFSTASLPWRQLQVCPAENPGYLLLDRRHRVLHAAHGDGSTVSTYALEEDGLLRLRGEQGTGGRNPAHLALSPSGRWVLATNHSSGTVASLPVGPDGLLGEPAFRGEFSGEPGPHRTDQTGPKPHQALFAPARLLPQEPEDSPWMVVPDKGLDTVFFCRLEEATGKVRVVHSVRLREFSGPRHAAFHPRLPMLYVIDELASTVTVLDCSGLPDAAPRPVQILPSTAPEDVRQTRAAEIAVLGDGNLVLASNRSGHGDRAPAGPGPDTVAAYRIGSDGLLQAAAWHSTQGGRPRFFTEVPPGLAGPAALAPGAATSSASSTVAVAHEKSGDIRLLSFDGAGQMLGEPVRVARTASPTCIVFG